MRIDFLTLFPEMFEGVLHSSMLKKAQEKNAVRYFLHNFREYTENKHNRVDDYPYGGGAGMVLSPSLSMMPWRLSRRPPAIQSPASSSFARRENAIPRRKQESFPKNSI